MAGCSTPTPFSTAVALAETCDRHPSAIAYTAWYRADIRGLVVLCAHCTNAHDLALVEQRFELSIDNREDLKTRV